MIHNKVHHLVYTARERGIKLGYNSRDDIVLNDPRDHHTFMQIAESLGFQRAGSGLQFQDRNVMTPTQVDVTDQASEARRQSAQAPGKRYGAYSG